MFIQGFCVAVAVSAVACQPVQAPCLGMLSASEDESDAPPLPGKAAFACEEKYQVINLNGDHKAVFSVSHVDGKKFIHVAARVLERLHLVGQGNVGICSRIVKRLRCARDSQFHQLLLEQGCQQRTKQRRYNAKGMKDKVLMMPETLEINEGGITS